MRDSVHTRYKLRQFTAKVLFYVLVIAFCFAALFPVYWMVVNSIQPLSYGMQYPPPLFPREISFLPFTTLFENFPVARWLVNSLLLAGMAPRQACDTALAEPLSDDPDLLVSLRDLIRMAF